MSNEFPLEIKNVDEDLNRRLLQDFTGERTGFVQVGPDKWFLPSKYRCEAGNFYHFKPRPDDTWVITYPRSGTTWTQELVWLIANNLDYEKAKLIPQVQRFCFLDHSMFVHDEIIAELLQENADDPEKVQQVERMKYPRYHILEKMESPRFIKTHFPFSLLPPNILDVGCKVIYVARNPKDVAVSLYYHDRLIRSVGYTGDFPRYWNYFQNNLRTWTPYWSHVKEGWERRHHPNVLFLFYEEMNKDLSTTITKVTEFLQHPPLSEEQVSSLVKHLDINNFRNNPSVNFDVLKDIGFLKSGEEPFIRKGKSGDWKEEFSPELNRQADQWIQENLKHTDLRFP